MSIPLEQRELEPQHEALRQEMLQMVAKYGDVMSREEMLAIAAHIVGQLIAVQNPATMSEAMAMEIIYRNIEIGNQSMGEALRKQQLETQPVAGRA